MVRSSELTHKRNKQLTVAKKIFPSSLPTPSRIFNRPDKVTADLLARLVGLIKP